MTLLWIALLHIAAGLFGNRLCNLANPAGITGYTGIRIYRRVSYGLPFLHHWHIVWCRSGSIAESQIFATTRDANFMWREPWCLTEGECFVAARGRRFVERQMPIFAPGTIVGGLFRCGSEDSCEESKPHQPLIASNQAESFGILEKKRYVKYIPTMHTPMLPLPLSGVDPMENYVYTPSDRFKPWHAANVIVNALAHVRIDERWLPWEYDALDHALSEP